jgi:hypothetical protein
MNIYKKEFIRLYSKTGDRLLNIDISIVIAVQILDLCLNIWHPLPGDRHETQLNLKSSVNP